MSLAEVDCMGCLVNMARSLEVMDDFYLRGWDEVVHAAVWEPGPGHIAAACAYELHNTYGSHVKWRHKGQHGSH